MPTARLNRSLILSALCLALRVGAQVPMPGQSLTFDSGLPGLGPSGACITASANADGAHVVINACGVGAAPTPNNTWVAMGGVGEPGQLRIFGDKCLDVTGGVNADGTKLQIWTCASGDTNQLWVSAGQPGSPHIVWSGKNKCIDLTDGNSAWGTQLQVWDCDTSGDNSNQNWSIGITNNPKTVSMALLSDPSLCISASGNATGAPIVAGTCPSGTSTTAATWIGNGVGPIKNALYPNLCIATTANGTAIANGNKLVTADCASANSNPAAAWSLDWQTNQVVNVIGDDKCVDLTDGTKTAGTQLQIWDCVGGNTNQAWKQTYTY